MTNLQEFILFFQKMGVQYRFMKYTDEELKHSPMYADELKETRQHLSVSQAHFCFDDYGGYLGALADDMGFFEPKGV